MNKFIEKIKTFLMSYTYPARLKAYKKEMTRFNDMSDDELHFEYIEIKALYERNKRFVPLLAFFNMLVVIAFYLFLNFIPLSFVWNFLYLLMTATLLFLMVFKPLASLKSAHKKLLTIERSIKNRVK